VIFISDILAFVYGWYWSVQYVDSIHHFLGGLWIASVVCSFLNIRKKIFDIKKSFLVSLILVLGVVAIAGIGWEFFEFGLEKYAETQIVVYEKLGLQDTLADLFFDILGGLIFAILYLLSFREKLG